MKVKADPIRQKQALDLCSKTFNSIGIELDLEAVLSKTRVSNIVLQRALIVHILRKRDYSYTEIGSFINRDHATALNLTRYLDANKKKFPIMASLLSKLNDPIDELENELIELQQKVVELQNKITELKTKHITQ